MSTERLDQHLVRTGLARSRNVAQRLIRTGSVLVEGEAVDKPSYAVHTGQRVTVTPAEEHRWVGRGALKLLRALEVWGSQEGTEPDHAPADRTGGGARGTGRTGSAEGLRVVGRRCLDVGASTGGFTQVLLEHGAAAVTALDVGHGQLADEVARDPRVTDLPGTNIRDVGPAEVGTFELVVGDVSFISLTLVLPAVARLVETGADLVFLVKPQFEVGREHLGRGGIVTSPAQRARVLTDVTASALTLGWWVRGLERSPVRGTQGNTEYLLWLATYEAGMMSVGATAARIRELTREDD